MLDLPDALDTMKGLQVCGKRKFIRDDAKAAMRFGDESMPAILAKCIVFTHRLSMKQAKRVVFTHRLSTHKHAGHCFQLMGLPSLDAISKGCIWLAKP